MPTLLLEIGCEELPAVRLPRGRRRSCRSSSERTSGGDRRASTSARGGSRCSSRTLPERDARRVGAGARRGDRLRRRGTDEGGRGLRAQARRRGRTSSSVRDGFVWAYGARASALAERAARAARRDRRAASRSAKSMAWERGGLRFARPVRWLARSSTARRSRSTVDGVPSGSDRTATASRTARSRSRTRGRIRRAPARRPASSPTPDERRRADRRRARRDSAAGATPPACSSEVVYLVESPIVLGGHVRRALPRAARARDRDRDAVAPALLPARRDALRVRRERRRPETVVRAGNERVLDGRLEDASFTFERDVARGHRRAGARRSSRSPSSRGAGIVRRQDRAARARSSRRSAAARPRVRRRGWRRPTRRPSSCASSPSSRATSAPSTRASRATPRRSARRSRSSTCPTRAGGPLPETEAGRVLAAADKIDNLTVAFALGQRPTGSRDPVRAAPRGDRPLPARDRGAARARRRRARATRAPRCSSEQGAEVTDEPSAEVADFVLERLEGLLDVPVEFVRAARGGELRDARRSRALADDARRLAGRASSTPCLHRLRPRRTGWPERADQAAPALDPGLVVRGGRARARRSARSRRGPRSRRPSPPATSAGALRRRRAGPARRPLLRRRARDGRGRRRPREPPAAAARRPRRARAASAITQIQR